MNDKKERERKDQKKRKLRATLNKGKEDKAKNMILKKIINEEKKSSPELKKLKITINVRSKIANTGVLKLNRLCHNDKETQKGKDETLEKIK